MPKPRLMNYQELNQKENYRSESEERKKDEKGEKQEDNNLNSESELNEEHFKMQLTRHLADHLSIYKVKKYKFDENYLLNLD